MILLDTSVCIEFFRKQKKERTYFFALAGQEQPLAISAITQYEVLIGKTKNQSSFWSRFFERLTIFPFDTNEATLAAELYQSLHAQNKLIGLADLAIGATAIVNGCQLATLNLKHFSRITDIQLHSFAE
jgi:tRNA(fMet)-specific endonuclease VapC